MMNLIWKTRNRGFQAAAACEVHRRKFALESRSRLEVKLSLAARQRVSHGSEQFSQVVNNATALLASVAAKVSTSVFVFNSKSHVFEIL